MTVTRCAWVSEDQDYRNYHDEEWGIPVYDDHRLFEFLILEGAQAGLSWLTVLKKRACYRTSFAHFDPVQVARFDASKVRRLLENPGLIRNRLKIESAVTNAQSYLKVVEQKGCFSDYLWSFVDGKPLLNHWRTSEEVPTRTALSDRMSKDLKQWGFRFVGTTICYALMQAVGLVDDHTTHCFCYEQRSRRVRG